MICWVDLVMLMLLLRRYVTDDVKTLLQQRNVAKVHWLIEVAAWGTIVLWAGEIWFFWPILPQKRKLFHANLGADGQLGGDLRNYLKKHRRLLSITCDTILEKEQYLFSGWQNPSKASKTRESVAVWEDWTLRCVVTELYRLASMEFVMPKPDQTAISGKKEKRQS